VVLALILIIPMLQDLAKRAFAPDPLLPPSLRRKWPPVIQVPGKYLWGILLTSLAAWIGSLPLVAYYFNIFTPVSTPANIRAVPEMCCGGSFDWRVDFPGPARGENNSTHYFA